MKAALVPLVLGLVSLVGCSNGPASHVDAVSADASAHAGRTASWLRIPADVEPPIYTLLPERLADGSVIAIHDSEWGAIVFYRPTECVRADFNLLDVVDAPGAFFCQPMLVEGSGRFAEGALAPSMTKVKGTGSVPVWFVRWSELGSAMADGELTMAQLAAMTTLRKGTASYYQEENHLASHNTSHLTLNARGTLEDGTRFSMHAVEVKLAFTNVRIAFE